MDRANGINDAGLVVGDYGGNNIATTWTASGGYHEVRRLDGTTACCSSLIDVNAGGVAAGWSHGDNPVSSMVWSQATDTKTDLLIPERAYASSINDGGDVVGYHFNLGYPFVAYYKPSGGAPVTLAQLPGTVNAYAWQINNSRMIVGENQLGANLGYPIHAVVWTNPNSSPTDLGTLGGTNSHAYGVNQVGDVVGTAEMASGVAHAFLWTSGGGMVDLSSWPNPCTGPSAARSVNDLGIIVGTCNAAPVYWTAMQGMRSLSLPSGVTQASPLAINNKNQVVGIYNGFGGAFWTIGVPNAPPVLTSFTLPSAAVALGDPVTVTASFTDPDASNSHTAIFTWGDGQTSSVAASPDGGSGMVSATHTYSAANSYVVSVQLTDDGGLSVTRTSAATGQSITVLAPGQTVAGTSVAVTPIDPATGTSPATLTFATVTAGGTTSVSTSGTGAPPPLGFKLGNPPVYYELQTSATFTGAITVCFAYTPSAFRNPGNLRLFHGGTSGGWTDVTTSNSVSTGQICGNVTSLSPFILAELSYDFVGFLQPVDNPGTTNVVNTLKAGSAVPVKFTLGGNLGLNILAANSPSSALYACGGGIEDAVEETVTAGGSSFTYDATTGQYIYVWKTDKAWAGTCRKLTVTLKDGTSRQALFKLTK
jgi:probable HAF family extracellular repeat protein